MDLAGSPSHRQRSAAMARVLRHARGKPPFALCYHGIGDVGPHGDPHGLMVTQARFTAHLDALANRNWVSVEALAAATAAGHGSGLGAITFDDGLQSTLRTALPVLLDRGIPVTAYLATGLLGQPHPHLPDEQRIITPAEVREWSDAGVTIGAHSVDHLDLTDLPYSEVLDQLVRSRAALEDITGRAVTTMAYPFGSYDARTVAAADEAGYTVACGCSGPGPWRPLELPREPVHRRTSVPRLRAKAAGLYGPVHLAGRVRSAVRRLG